MLPEDFKNKEKKQKAVMIESAAQTESAAKPMEIDTTAEQTVMSTLSEAFNSDQNLEICYHDDHIILFSAEYYYC